MYISSSVNHKERCFKVAKCIYHHVFITRKDVLKLRNVYITMCSSQGKLFKCCGMYIYQHVLVTTKVVLKLRNIYHQVLVTRKDVRKLRNAFIIKCLSQ